VTPAYRRSALPTGQHMISTQEYPVSAANVITSSNVKSANIALKNPSLTIVVTPVI
jgi:hypothetical protein